MAQNKRILVVGSSNVGKTSMLNELCGLDMQVNNDARGCTLGTEPLDPIEHGNCQYVFSDTAGLNETDKGTVTNEQALRNIAQLIRTARIGFNLIIFVIRSGTIHGTDKANYDLFFEILTHKKIPIMCVITNCENEDSMTEYANRNRQTYEENGMHFIAFEATCFAKGGRLEKVIYGGLRGESGQRVWTAIERHASPTPIKCIDDENFGITIKRTWNKFCDWVRKPSWRAIANKDLYEILGRMGIQDEGIRRRIADDAFREP